MYIYIHIVTHIYPYINTYGYMCVYMCTYLLPYIDLFEMIFGVILKFVNSLALKILILWLSMKSLNWGGAMKSMIFLNIVKNSKIFQNIFLCMAWKNYTTNLNNSIYQSIFLKQEIIIIILCRLQTAIFMLVAIFKMFRPLYSPAFFKWLLSYSITFSMTKVTKKRPETKTTKMSIAVCNV